MSPSGAAGTTHLPPVPPAFAEALAAVSTATHPDDLFPADLAAAARRYRRLARLLHPDTAPAAHRAVAGEAFRSLTQLWELHRCAGAPAGREPVLTTGRHEYRLGPVTASGDLAVLRAAGARRLGPGTDQATREVLLKIPGTPDDNDLMEREATALARLARFGDPRFRPYVPTLVESFRHQDVGAPGGRPRRVNALLRLTGFRPLTEVRRAFPAGLDGRDAAWIWRRLLVALGFAHRAGVRHGAVLPEHVLIHPEVHGLVLVDWCYATTGDHLPAPALVERHRAWYPPEVPARRPVTEATDLHLAARCLEELMGEQAPKQLRAFIAGCTLPAEARRPHDAWRLLAELDVLLDGLYGPRTFRPLHLPPTT